MKDRETFASLFPVYKEYISKLDSFFDKLLKDMIRFYQKKNSVNHAISENPNESLLRYFYTEINREININIDDEDHEEYIKQYIMSVYNVDILYGIIWS